MIYISKSSKLLAKSIIIWHFWACFCSFCMTVHQKPPIIADPALGLGLAQANQDPDFVVFHGLDREIRILHNIIHFVAFKKPFDSRKLKEYKQKNNLYHLYTILGSNSPWYSETHSYIVPNLWRLLFIQPNNDKNNELPRKRSIH